jgi:hypothetical protein
MMMMIIIIIMIVATASVSLNMGGGLAGRDRWRAVVSAVMNLRVLAPLS